MEVLTPLKLKLSPSICGSGNWNFLEFFSRQFTRTFWKVGIWKCLTQPVITNDLEMQNFSANWSNGNTDGSVSTPYTT